MDFRKLQVFDQFAVEKRHSKRHSLYHSVGALFYQDYKPVKSNSYSLKFTLACFSPVDRPPLLVVSKY